MKYRFTLDRDLASVYAKRNCKKCHGEGMVCYRDVGQIKERWDYCSCSRRNMKKYNK